MAGTKTSGPEGSRSPLATCPHCSAVLPELPGPSGLFDCKGCGAEVEAAVPASSAPFEAQEDRPAEAAKPKSIRHKLGPSPPELSVTELPGALKLEWTTRREGVLALTAWLGVILITLFFTVTPKEPGAYVWLLRASLVLGLASIGWGAWLARKPKRAAMMLSGTELLAPGWPKVRVDPQTLSQVYVREVEHHRNASRGGPERWWYTYEVRARLRNGEHCTLISGFTSPELPLHLERLIEAHYRIADARVACELPRE